MQPLVSIVIPAYNAERTVAEAIKSAIGQTWPRKEIIVVDDGSTDRTAEIVARFAPAVRLVSSGNLGLSAAVNLAVQESHGDYIQELDADDLLTPDKIERQLAALRPGDSKRILLSSSWAGFYYRTQNARFVNNALCQDLSPVEWLLKKMSENLYMQNATWLVSRELVEAAGPWDTRLNYDQDGEYFARVIACSTGTRFVPGTGVFYRASGPGSISYIGNSDEKKESLWLSMQLQIKYLLALENSERVRRACIAYLQNWYENFYPERSDLAAQAQKLAAELGGIIKEPRLRRKFAWLEPLFGRRTAKWAQMMFPRMKGSLLRSIDKTMFALGELCKPNAVLSNCIRRVNDWTSRRRLFLWIRYPRF
jgi:glycosyltransferase involved in cell wall biosynthesis